MAGQCSKGRIGRAALGGLLAALMVVGVSGKVWAADDDDDDSVEQKVIKGILSGFGVNVGGGGGIDYRERSPLVVPPSRDLPPPEDSALVNNPAWPKNPEARKKTVKRDVRSVSSEQLQQERANPVAQEQAGPAGAGRVTEADPNANLDPGRALTPSEMGAPKGGLFSNLFSAPWKTTAEEGKFDQEPTRGNLTQPPPGYQTPSPNYPYGVGVDRKTNGVQTLPQITDRNAASQ